MRLVVALDWGEKRALTTNWDKVTFRNILYLIYNGCEHLLKLITIHFKMINFVI